MFLNAKSCKLSIPEIIIQPGNLSCDVCRQAEQTLWTWGFFLSIYHKKQCEDQNLIVEAISITKMCCEAHIIDSFVSTRQLRKILSAGNKTAMINFKILFQLSVLEVEIQWCIFYLILCLTCRDMVCLAEKPFTYGRKDLL